MVRSLACTRYAHLYPQAAGRVSHALTSTAGSVTNRRERSTFSGCTSRVGCCCTAFPITEPWFVSRLRYTLPINSKNTINNYVVTRYQLLTTHLGSYTETLVPNSISRLYLHYNLHIILFHTRNDENLIIIIIIIRRREDNRTSGQAVLLGPPDHLSNGTCPATLWWWLACHVLSFCVVVGRG